MTARLLCRTGELAGATHELGPSNTIGRWGLRMSQRTTISEAEILAKRGKTQYRGVLIGIWDDGDIPEELWTAYRHHR